MEQEPQALQSDLAQNPEHPDQVIDLRETSPEPTGVVLLENLYAKDPELLIQNTSLALILLMQATDKVVTLGPDYDGTLLGEKTQVFSDQLLLSMASNKPSDSFSIVLSELANKAGSPSEELFSKHAIEFVEHKKKYLEKFNSYRYEQRLEPQQKLKDSVYLFMFAAERLLDSRLDTMIMGHEGGDINSLNQELFIEYCSQFRDESNIPTGTQNGLSGQVRRRLCIEANHLQLLEFNDH